MFHTQIKLTDGSTKDIKSTNELEITAENGMVRFTFFDEKKKQILVRTDLIVSILVEESENPQIELFKKDETVAP